MPNKPKLNFSEGMLKKMADYATGQISESDLISYLYKQDIANPEQFLKDREPLFCAIRSVIEQYRQ